MEKQFEEFKEIKTWIHNTTEIEATRAMELTIEIYRNLKEAERNERD